MAPPRRARRMGKESQPVNQLQLHRVVYRRVQPTRRRRKEPEQEEFPTPPGNSALREKRGR